MLTTAKLLDKLTLSDRVGVQQCALRDRDVELQAVLGDGQARDRLLAVRRVDEVLFDSALPSHDSELLWNDHNVDLTSLGSVLED